VTPAPSGQHPISRRTALAAGAAASVALATTLGGGTAAAQAATPPAPAPTFVLVHGAFADASSWNAVIAALQARGHTVLAPANPLRGIAADAETLRVFLSTVAGPVVLVGHSYGGAVITNAATGNAAVSALVYIAAYALDVGETISAANDLGGGTALLGQHVQVRPFPGSGATDADASIDPAFFREVFAQDLPRRQATVMAAAQRPLVASALGTPSGQPAWRSIPSWYLVATDDHAIPPEAERAMAARAKSHTVEIASSHVAMISHPQKVVKLILTAAGRR
jgi:pimeloyl-ACP methyl ester carboxylesterase